MPRNMNYGEHGAETPRNVSSDQAELPLIAGTRVAPADPAALCHI